MQYDHCELDRETHLDSKYFYSVVKIHLASCFSLSVCERLDGAQQRVTETSWSPAVAWRPLTPCRQRKRRSCPPAVRPENDRQNTTEQNGTEQEQNRIQ